jgi:hypothetical protein
LEEADQSIDADAVVPDVELGHRRVVAHASGIGIDGRGDGGVDRPWSHAVLAASRDQAGCEPFEIPLERTRQRLVKIPQVELQVALGRRPETEIEHVRVAAELDVQPAVRLRGEVVGHDCGGTSEVGPRRRGHAPVPQRHELGDPEPALGQDRLQRVVPSIGFPPTTHRTSWRPRARGPSGAMSLGDRV